jgi:hypothetical protein
VAVAKSLKIRGPARRSILTCPQCESMVRRDYQEGVLRMKESTEAFRTATCGTLAGPWHHWIVLCGGKGWEILEGGRTTTAMPSEGGLPLCPAGRRPPAIIEGPIKPLRFRHSA